MAVRRVLYPSPGLLRLLDTAGVPFTTASDAHDVEQLGDRFDEIEAALRGLGTDEVTTFTCRRPQRIPL